MTLSVWVQCQVTVLTEAPPVEVKPTVGSEQVAHLKTVNCSCSAGEKVSVECVFFLVCWMGLEIMIPCK